MSDDWFPFMKFLCLILHVLKLMRSFDIGLLIMCSALGVRFQYDKLFLLFLKTFMLFLLSWVIFFFLINSYLDVGPPETITIAQFKHICSSAFHSLSFTFSEDHP